MQPQNPAGDDAGHLLQPLVRGHVLRVRRRDFEAITRLDHQFAKVMRAWRRWIIRIADDQNMFEMRKRRSQLADFAPAVEQIRGDQHFPLANRKALLNRLRPEGGKQRAKHAAVL